MTEPITLQQPDTIRVLLADDHPLIRAGIRTTLAASPNLILVGEASNGFEAQRMSDELQPDVLLLDLNMPGPSAVNTITHLRLYTPKTKVLALTAYDDDAYVRALVTAGVAGYVLKDEATESVVSAIEAVVQGGTWFSQPIAEKLIEWGTGRTRQDKTVALTDRELAVLKLLVAGKTNQKIGEALGISEKAVEKRLEGVFGKLGVSSRVEAAVRAMREGLV